MINIIAYTCTVIGIGGIAGAIERGTSLAAAVVCLGVGCVCMRLNYKRGETKHEETSNRPAAYGIYGGIRGITGRGKDAGAV